MCHNPLQKKACEIIRNKEIAADIFSLKIAVGEMVTKIKPGQFVNLYVNDTSTLLPRPISICSVNKKTQEIELIYTAVGKGTKLISKMKEGKIEVLGPLGNGFILDDFHEKAITVIGGGVGTPPLLELEKRLKQQYPSCKITTILGFKDETYLAKCFQEYGDVRIATDTGSVGYKGNVIQCLEAENVVSDYIFTCGPTPMLKAVQEYAKKNKIPAQLSLEERMGCGFGACVGCVVAIKEGNDYIYKKVCKDGPVFKSDEVIFGQ